MTTDTYPRETYGHTEPEVGRPTCSLCSTASPGFITVRREPTEVVQPCPACAPATFARWEAGHLGCHRRECEVCRRILAADTDGPARGADRWLD